MKVRREWNDNEELAEAIFSALHAAQREGEIDGCYMSGEQGTYGEDGTIRVNYDGRAFLLELHELV